MKKITNFLKNMFFLMAILLINQAFAQSGVLSGKVTDSKGEAVIGANVVAGSNSTMTDSNGIYTFSSVSNGSITITTSYIGFQTNVKEAIVEGNTTIDFVLQEETSDLNEVVVTGVVNPKTKLKSSVSITTVNAKQIEQSAPRSTAEIFRTIPGIRSESSGGEGNSNISVRGVPISSGGSKYLQIQEDGLPVLLYGDISFGTADIFTRFDRNVAKIEAIRGGSASTLSSNSPGGIINFISKTGKTEGGSMATSFGLDYNDFRTDVEYGSRIGEGLYFHVGGFYRAGEGVRSPGFTANNGGQFKFNITKEFENGSVTIYTKFLNDRAAAYMPMPIKVTGTNSDPNWDSVSGYDATTGALQSVYLSQNVGLGSDGELRRGKVADGMHPVSKTIGASINFDLLNGWKLSNNGRFSFNNGQFIAPFPAEVASAASIANSFGAGSTLSYANDGSAFNTANGLVARIHMFDVQLNNFNNFMNDFRITKKYDKVGITAGYFKSIQNISMSWLWNSYLQEVSDNNPRLINVIDASGNLLSQNGLYAYGVPYWGNCCTRNYDTQYNVSAPYANVTLDATEKLSLEGGIRYDKGQVDGSFSGAVQTVYDINNDGDISTPESSVSAVDTANSNAVDYSYGYVSYTLGANYLLNEQQSFFVRYSKGASAKADRILFSGLNYLDGDKINSLDYLAQAEFGYKRKFSKGYLYATLFSSATTEEGGFEASSNSIIDNDYKSYGLELESSYDVNEDLNFRGGFTYTKAEITSGANDGNQPRRQPKLMYNFIPTYKFSQSKNTLGLSFIGQTKAYAQDNNDLVMNGFVIVNGFVEFGLTKGLSLNVAGNNLLDTLAITESEEGSITENTTNIVRARPLPGRSISMTLSYKF
ncbi:TonB-dependent receptor domain-containing protein [Flavobacterium celericrescens]|uniref:TonB-dependent receptor n=1 Tax=Flavobacterium celericrescens TaxID=2709780 RepID=A0ABX0I7F5_9FLAO|nr:TonB-dependent receptor [Flavobacterium celericrescens]NHM03105.1 TonB-dependent receptor [Flavobacterium celericrescens]